MTSYLEIRSGNPKYTYPTGRIRGLEKYLLTSSDITRLQETPNLKECYEALTRYHHYSDSLRGFAETFDYEQALEQEWARTHHELRGFAPELELLDLFWLEQDVHNTKVILKLQHQNNLPEDVGDIELLSVSATVPRAAVYAAVVKDDLHAVPPSLAVLISDAHSALEKGIMARQMDVLLDRHFLQMLVQGLATFHDSFLDQLGHKLVDAYNIKALVRIKLWERDDERLLLEAALSPGGSISTETLLSHSGGGLEFLLDAFRASTYFHSVQHAIQEWHSNHTLFALTRYLREDLLEYLERGAYITFGREPLIRYIFLKKTEIGRLRHVFRAKQAGIPVDSIPLG